jgi:hypothetical protein
VRRSALLAVLVLVAGGCGGGGERLGRTAYVRQADAICSRYNTFVKNLGVPQRPAEIVSFTTKALAELDKALDDERKLRPPRELDGLKERWLARAQIVRGDVARLRDAARRNDVDAINAALEKGNRDDQRSNALAAQLGLKVCSKP